MRVPVGVSSTGQKVFFQLDAHSAIAGQSGSGKSVFAYNVLSNAAHFVKAGKLQISGIDGTSLLLAPFSSQPNILLGNYDPAEAIALLRSLKEETDRRTAWLLENDKDKMTYQDFSPERPAHLVVFEEMPGILPNIKAQDDLRGAKPAERLAPQFQSLVAQLLAQSRKAGIFCLFLAQRMDVGASGLDGFSRSNIAQNVLLKSSPEGSRMMFPDLEGDELRLVTNCKPGVFLKQDEGVAGRVYAKGPYQDYSTYAKTVRSLLLESQHDEAEQWVW